MRMVLDKRDAKSERSKKSAPIGPPAAAVHGFDDDDVENQAVYAAWGGRSSWRGRGLVQALNITEAPSSADEKFADDDGFDSGVDGIETHLSVFTFLKIVTAISALYMCTNPWFLFYDADKGEICPYTVICARSPVEMTLLTGSRISAGVLYPSIVITVFSKCYATRSFLHHSWLGAVLEFEPTHEVHTYFGSLMLVAAMEHGILHCTRFIYAKEAFLIWETDTGRSGLVGCLLLLPIVLPMKFGFFRTKMTFQFRKGLHLLFLPLMAALCFHSPHFRYVGSLLIVWYLLDRLYFTTKQTFLIPHPVFEAVGRGTMVMLDLPTGYTFKAGSYIYVNSPMISRSEWHPFSIIQVPGKESRAAFYAEAVGDWTQDLFHLGLEQPRLPLWITAAQPSLMEKSIYYDNIVLVCTGAGITPAVSIIERFAKTKNIHLLWMSRDGGMVALFEKQVNSTVHLTGSQTEETKTALKRLFKPSAKQDASTMQKVSFRSILANDSFDTKPSITPGGGKAGNDSCEGIAATNGDADDSDRLPSRQIMLLNMSGRSKDLSKRHHRLSMTKNKRTDPVTLAFGRPDIGTYLTGTFALETETHEARTDCGLDTGDPLASKRDIAGVPDHLSRQRSTRLDSDQKVYKKELMKADVTIVQARNQQRVKGAKGKGNTNRMSSNRSSASCPLPWLVLYCGANPRVEEAIAKTCVEEKVTWQKEYFGAW